LFRTLINEDSLDCRVLKGGWYVGSMDGGLKLVVEALLDDADLIVFIIVNTKVKFAIGLNIS